MLDDLKIHQDDRINLLKFSWSIDSSDKIIAIGIYLALFFASAATYVIQQDPYMEYALLTSYVSEARALRSQILSIKDFEAHSIQNAQENLKTEILELRSKLWLLDSNDLIGLSPYDSQKKKERCSEQSGITHDQIERPNRHFTPSNNAQPSADENSDGEKLLHRWVANRLERYARTYLLIFGRGAIKDYASSFKQALEHQFT